MADGIKILAQNKKAWHDYFVLEQLEAGIALIGTEVKSIRNGGVNDGELLARGIHISPYEKGNIFNRDPLRDRRLLVHKREIRRLFDAVKQDGLTIVPLKLYLKNSKIKLEIGLCKGKKLYDKRAVEAKRDADRERDQQMKTRELPR